MTSARPRICFQLALWGKSYISMFCDISLRTLLAKGNIPALAQEYECIFMLLTNENDIPFFERQKLFPTLRKYCDIRYIDIQDIIFPRNHSATLTMAFERGVRTQGEAALNTYFIFLVADYLFAEKALSGLLPYIRQGVSAITAGNYQVVEEEVLEDIRQFVDPVTKTISIPSRELVSWSLRHLHPLTVANIINAPDTHTPHTNRLFWRVDNDTLIGRFYLRHMLCIKPETLNYIIGASCDYSFIPEMCPSGNIAHIMDSDEYFVIELQPLTHEGTRLALGPYTSEILITSLAEWATLEQRANAHIPVIYHGKDTPSATKSIIEKSGRYIEQIEAAMSTPPIATRGHFYWLSCIQAIAANIALAPDKYVEEATDMRRNVWESPVFSSPFKAAGLSMDMFPFMRDEDVSASYWLLLLSRLYFSMMGHLPYVYPWHPHFLDYRLLTQALAEKPGPTLAILTPTRQQWMAWSGQPGFVLRTPLITYRHPDSLRAELQAFSSCVIYLPAEYDGIIGKLFDCLLHAMPPGSLVHIVIKSSLRSGRSFSPKHIALRYAHLAQKPGVRFVIQRSYSSIVRGFMDRRFSLTVSRLIYNRNRPIKAVWYIFQIAVLHICYIFHNLLSLLLRPLNRLRTGKTVCSAVLTFKVEQ